MFAEKPKKPGRRAIRAGEVKLRSTNFEIEKYFQIKFRFYLK